MSFDVLELPLISKTFIIKACLDAKIFLICNNIFVDIIITSSSISIIIKNDIDNYTNNNDNNLEMIITKVLHR